MQQSLSSKNNERMKIKLDVSKHNKMDSFIVHDCSEVINEIELEVRVQRESVIHIYNLFLDVNSGRTSNLQSQEDGGLLESNVSIDYDLKLTQPEYISRYIPSPSSEKCNNLSGPELESKITEQETFLSLPTDDGYFDSLEVSNKMTAKFPYQYFVDTLNPKEANIILETKELSLILLNMQSSLFPICDVENPNTEITAIETIEDGIIRMEGRRWKIVKKIKVKFK